MLGEIKNFSLRNLVLVFDVKNCVISRFPCVVRSKIVHIHNQSMCMKTLSMVKLKVFIYNRYNEPPIHPHIHSLSQVILTPTIHGLGFIVSLFVA